MGSLMQAGSLNLAVESAQIYIAHQTVTVDLTLSVS